jgi:hypothetical protein
LTCTPLIENDSEEQLTHNFILWLQQQQQQHAATTTTTTTTTTSNP